MLFTTLWRKRERITEIRCVGRNLVNWVASETRRRLHSSSLHQLLQHWRLSSSFVVYLFTPVSFPRAFVPTCIWLESLSLSLSLSLSPSQERVRSLKGSQSLVPGGVRLDPDAESSQPTLRKTKVNNICIVSINDHYYYCRLLFQNRYIFIHNMACKIDFRNDN